MTLLPQIRQQLMLVHRSLLDAQRLEYERVHGRVSAGAYLELVVGAPEFAWLQPMTAMIVGLDEAIDAPLAESEQETARLQAAYIADVRKLVSADLEGSEAERRYAEALQSSPDVVVAHGGLMRVLSQ